MNAAGVIVEYNPFHNGHSYHIQRTKEITGADIVVAIMSGNFLQRGEPALVSKWSRTRMALLNGADIVIELPYVFATQKAEIFAFGSISLLSALQVKSVCFGSEDGDIDRFRTTLQVMGNKNKGFNCLLQDSLQEGKSYPRAAAEAFRALGIHEVGVDLSKPNNILGFHYIQAIDHIKSSIIPLTIKRSTANYHDQQIESNTIASATSIRKALFSEDGTLSMISNVIPNSTAEQLTVYKNKYGMFHQWENYFPFFKYRLLASTPTDLKSIYEVEEGLENRILRSIMTAESFQEFMETLKTKRYTWTRLQRLCTHILTNTKKYEMKTYSTEPTYIRLLGATTKGQNYLNQRKKNITLPIVAKLSAFDNPQIQVDKRATNIYASCLQEPYRSIMIKEEFSTPPIRYEQVNNTFL